MAKNTGEKSYTEYIDMKKIPILPLDNRWHQLFPNNLKTPRIKKLEKEVMNLVKRESSVNHELKKLVGAKKKLMNQIVLNMEEARDEEEKLRQKKVDASQKLIMDINKKSNELENEKYSLPYKLLKANEELLIESIDICYQRLNNNEEKIRLLNDWIERTRTELKKNVVIKQEMQDESDNIYSYMHDILGPRFIDVFDKKNDSRNKSRDDKSEE